MCTDYRTCTSCTISSSRGCSGSTRMYPRNVDYELEDRALAWWVDSGYPPRCPHRISGVFLLKIYIKEADHQTIYWCGLLFYILMFVKVLLYLIYGLSTICHRRSCPFYIVSYYIKWVITFWTDSIYV